MVYTLALPRLDPAEIAKNIANLSRQPFRDQVARMLVHAPTEGAIDALAERAPDRYWQMLTMAAKLAGYNDKLEIEASLSMQVSQMSDAELLQAVGREGLALPCYREGDASQPVVDQ